MQKNINGATFRKMIIGANNYLDNNQKYIDSLNVYCPQCGIKMNGVTDIDAPIVVFGHANYYRCPVCKVECNYSEDIFINRIKTNIEKKKKKI